MLESSGLVGIVVLRNVLGCYEMLSEGSMKLS